MLRRALNGGLHAVLGAATTTTRAKPPPPPVVTTRRAPPPRKTLLAEHVASMAELKRWTATSRAGYLVSAPPEGGRHPASGFYPIFAL